MFPRHRTRGQGLPWALAGRSAAKVADGPSGPAHTQHPHRPWPRPATTVSVLKARLKPPGDRCPVTAGARSVQHEGAWSLNLTRARWVSAQLSVTPQQTERQCALAHVTFSVAGLGGGGGCPWCSGMWVTRALCPRGPVLDADSLPLGGCRTRPWATEEGDRESLTPAWFLVN